MAGRAAGYVQDPALHPEAAARRGKKRRARAHRRSVSDGTGPAAGPLSGSSALPGADLTDAAQRRNSSADKPAGADPVRNRHGPAAGKCGSVGPDPVDLISGVQRNILLHGL